MKKTNSIVLLIVALLLIIVGGGIYFAQKSGRINLSAAFTGWPDVSTTDPAYTEIMAVGERGWMSGYSDGTFRPDTSTDRAQIIVSEVLALGLEVTDASTSCIPDNPLTWPFIDVPCDHWAINYIWTAKENSLISQFPGETFEPDESATKAEMVAFIMRSAGQTIPDYACSGAADYPFPDIHCDHWAYRYIRFAKEHNIIFATSSGNFEPGSIISRRDLAVMLYRTFISAAVEVTVSGQITNATGNPIVGANVNVDNVTAQGSRLTTDSDSTGNYTLSFVSAPTTYAIIASATGYQNKTINVNASQNTTLNISLTPLGQNEEGTISGSVKNKNGVAIPGASVTVLSYESGSQLSDITDSRGYYSLRVGAITGTFSVKVSSTGYQSKTSAATLSQGNAYLNFVLLRITPTANGQNPDISNRRNGNISATSTGAVLPVVLVLVGTVLSLFSLIYLLKMNKKQI